MTRALFVLSLHRDLQIINIYLSCEQTVTIWGFYLLDPIHLVFLEIFSKSIFEVSKGYMLIKSFYEKKEILQIKKNA